MFRPTIVCVVFALLCGQTAPVVKAAIVTDQLQSNEDAFFGAFGTQSYAQSFQQSVGNIAGASLRIAGDVTGVGEITISLFDDIGVGGVLLASGVDSVNVVDASGAEARVDFNSLVSIAPNTVYYLVFSSDNPDLQLRGTQDNLYADGEALFVTPPGPLGGVDPNSNDFAFATYADSSVTAVPEPSAFAVFGAVLLAGGVRRFRSTATLAE